MATAAARKPRPESTRPFIAAPAPKPDEKRFGLVVGGPEWKEMAERAKEHNLVMEQALQEGLVLCGLENPTLDEEAWDWLGRFYATGAKIAYHPNVGWSGRPGGSVGWMVTDEQGRQAWPLYTWMTKASERQPGLRRRVVELALGFDDMLAARREA